MDTTLFKNKDHAKLKQSKRRVIPDKQITPHLFDLLLAKVYYNSPDPENITQADVINTLYDKNISNETMAKVINYMIPKAKATQGSVASMIRFLRKKNDKRQSLADMLIKELEDELQL